MSPRRGIAIAVAAGIAGFIGWKGVQRFYLAPRADLADEIAVYRGDIQAKQRHVEKMKQTRRQLADIAQTTLAAEPDALEHRLRTELVALAEASGLGEVQVEGGLPQGRRNPVLSSRVQERRPLRAVIGDRPDFYVVRASLDGRGRLGEVITALATLQAQPWVARIESFNIKPEAGGRVFSLRVDLTTLFVPDLAGEDPPEAKLVALDEAQFARARRLGAMNVFRKPDPPEPVIVQKQEPPAPPPPPVAAPEAPPYGDWRLTGVMRGTSGTSAILVNSRTRETRTLAPGEAVLGFVFVAGEGEKAQFERAGEKVVLRNGQTLEERDQVD